MMLEAMSRGVPLVSTDVSDAREGLEPGPDGQPPGLVTGFAPPGDRLGHELHRLRSTRHGHHGEGHQRALPKALFFRGDAGRLGGGAGGGVKYAGRGPYC